MNTNETLSYLCLTWIRANLDAELADAARKQRSHQEFLERLLAGEREQRLARAIERRFKDARLPARKSLAGFDWAWPAKINRDQVRYRIEKFGLRSHAEQASSGEMSSASVA